MSIARLRLRHVGLDHVLLGQLEQQDLRMQPSTCEFFHHRSRSDAMLLRWAVRRLQRKIDDVDASVRAQGRFEFLSVLDAC